MNRGKHNVGRALLMVLSGTGLTLAAVHLLLPPFWGNPAISKKISFLENAERPYDRLFIGSSRIFREVDPPMLDSTLADGWKSFNLGYPSMFAPEGDIVCERLIRSMKIKARTVYVELNPFRLFQEQELKSARDWYMVTPRVGWDLASHAWGMKWLSREKRTGYVEGASRACIKASFLPGLFDQYMERDGKDDEFVFGPDRDGFNPFDVKEAQSVKDKGLAERIRLFATDTSVIHEREQAILSYYQDPGKVPYSKVYRDMLENLMALGDERGIKVVFLLMPLSNSREQMSLFYSLPKDRRIDLCDPLRYPELYMARNVFDKGHLNSAGSRLLTMALANEIHGMGDTLTSAAGRQPGDPLP